MSSRTSNFLLIILYARPLEPGYLDKSGSSVSPTAGELFYVMKKKVRVVIVFLNSPHNLNPEARRQEE